MFCEYIAPSGLARSGSIVQEYGFAVTELLGDQSLSLLRKSIAPDGDNC